MDPMTPMERALLETVQRMEAEHQARTRQMDAQLGALSQTLSVLTERVESLCLYLNDEGPGSTAPGIDAGPSRLRP